MKKRLLQGALAVSAVSVMGLHRGESAAAQRIDTSVVNEAWAMSNYVYGGGLTESEIDETAEILKIDSRENVEEYAVTGEDLQTYLGYGSGSTASMISSVLIQREGEGAGVDVYIETPDRILNITEEQYINAAITAGVEDAIIQVASVRLVTGESALTGVYKAFDANGEKLDQDRMTVAQEELGTTSEIAGELEEEESMRFESGYA